MPRFDHESLELFVSVVEVGSINAAAAKAGRSQQAVSERMRRLESELGLSLLERGARGSTPTEAGEIVADWAADLLNANDTFAARLESLRTVGDADLWVAASQTIAGYLLPAWLGTLKGSETHGVTSPHVRAVNSVEVVREVRAGTVSLGFIETLDIPEDLATRTVGHDELVVVVAPEHPWVRRVDGISPDELAGTPLVVREEGSGTRHALERLLKEHDDGMRVAPPAAEFSAVVSIRGAVTAGIAPAVMSALTVVDDLAVGRVVRVPVRGLELRRPLTGIWLADRNLPEAAIELIEIAAR